VDADLNADCSSYQLVAERTIVTDKDKLYSREGLWTVEALEATRPAGTLGLKRLGPTERKLWTLRMLPSLLLRAWR
jgi:hypothetical protein